MNVISGCMGTGEKKLLSMANANELPWKPKGIQLPGSMRVVMNMVLLYLVLKIETPGVSEIALLYA